MDTTDSLTHNNPILILIRGLPGSGKSYLASALQQTIGADNVAILDPDKIDKTSKAYTDLCATLAAEGIEEKFFPNRFLKAEGYKAIDANQVIIWNQAFTDLHGFSRSMGALQEYATAHGKRLPELVVEVEVNPDVARSRVTDREKQGGHGVPDEAFTRFINTYQSFADKGFRTISVNGEDDIASSAATVLAALKELPKA
jgi:thymidylate kinase